MSRQKKRPPETSGSLGKKGTSPQPAGTGKRLVDAFENHNYYTTGAAILQGGGWGE